MGKSNNFKILNVHYGSWKKLSEEASWKTESWTFVSEKACALIVDEKRNSSLHGLLLTPLAIQLFHMYLKNGGFTRLSLSTATVHRSATFAQPVKSQDSVVLTHFINSMQ